MASWEMQIMLEDGRWASVAQGDHSPPYRYADEKEALKMLRVCYPCALWENRARVLQVEEEPNSRYCA